MNNVGLLATHKYLTQDLDLFACCCAGRLVGLSSLGLRSNCLSDLPTEVGRLTALTYLDASMNHIAVSDPFGLGRGGSPTVGGKGNAS